MLAGGCKITSPPYRPSIRYFYLDKVTSHSPPITSPPQWVPSWLHPPAPMCWTPTPTHSQRMHNPTSGLHCWGSAHKSLQVHSSWKTLLHQYRQLERSPMTAQRLKLATQQIKQRSLSEATGNTPVHALLPTAITLESYAGVIHCTFEHTNPFTQLFDNLYLAKAQLGIISTASMVVS